MKCFLVCYLVEGDVKVDVAGRVHFAELLGSLGKKVVFDTLADKAQNKMANKRPDQIPKEVSYSQI